MVSSQMQYVVHIFQGQRDRRGNFKAALIERLAEATIHIGTETTPCRRVAATKVFTPALEP